MKFLASQESFQWNGITSKRKGQKWGTEKNSFSRRNDYNNANRDRPVTLSAPKDVHLNGPIDFEKLPLLSYMPKVGVYFSVILFIFMALE